MKARDGEICGGGVVCVVLGCRWYLGMEVCTWLVYVHTVPAMSEVELWSGEVESGGGLRKRGGWTPLIYA